MGLQHPLAAIRRRGAQRGDAPAGFRFVAMGGSFTAGPGCEPEDRWADRLAGEADDAEAFRGVDDGEGPCLAASGGTD